MINNILLLSTGSQGNPVAQLLPFLLIIVILYFFMIRPQSKKAKEQKQFKELLQRGDKIITIGGLHGKIVEMTEVDCVIDLGNNVKVTIQRDAISMEATRNVYGGDKK